MKMSWSIAAAVALANAVTAFVLTVVVGLSLLSLLNIHDRDGGGSMGIFFFYAPLMAAIALLWGLAATGMTSASTWSQFGRALALAQLLPNALILSFFALKLIGRPVAPTLDGLALDFEAEVFVPDGLIPEPALRDENSRASLYASDRDNEYVTINRDAIALRDGVWVIPMRVRLNTKSGRRMLSFSPLDQAMITLDVSLRPQPVAADTLWTEPEPMRKGILADGTLDPSEARARYRVVTVPK